AQAEGRRKYLDQQYGEQLRDSIPPPHLRYEAAEDRVAGADFREAAGLWSEATSKTLTPSGCSLASISALCWKVLRNVSTMGVALPDQSAPMVIGSKSSRGSGRRPGVSLAPGTNTERPMP